MNCMSTSCIFLQPQHARTARTTPVEEFADQAKPKLGLSAGFGPINSSDHQLRTKGSQDRPGGRAYHTQSKV
jgi:hypothetical protein